MSTKVQADVAKVLDALSFEFQRDPSGKVGGPQNYTATSAALDALKGKTVTVDGDGSITIG